MTLHRPAGKLQTESHVILLQQWNKTVLYTSQGHHACDAEAGTTDALLPAIPILLELASHAEAAVACTAVQCLAILTEMFTQDAAAGFLSGDGLLMLADALQPMDEGSSAGEEEGSASRDPSAARAGQDGGDVDCMRQEQLLTCLTAACRFQPPVNIMAGTQSLRLLFAINFWLNMPKS